MTVVVISFIVCLLFFLGVGGASARRRKNTSDAYLLASRSTGPRVMALSTEVVAFNEPAVAMYRSFGFTQDGVLRHHVKRGSEFHDVVIFSLLDTEWHAQKAELLRKLGAKGML